MLKAIKLRFTTATVVAIIGAVVAVAVSFGAHLTQQNTKAILTLVGLLGAAITIGGGVKSAAMVRAGVMVESKAFHFTPASIVAIVGALIAVGVSFGLHVSQENIDSILRLVGLIAGGVMVGGAAKSSGMLRAGVHPIQTEAPRPRRTRQKPPPRGSTAHTLERQ